MGSGRDGERRVAAALAVAVQGQAVDDQGVGDQVEVLALVADGVCTSEPQRIVEGAVDRLGVVAAPVEGLEVRVGLSDCPQVLRPVQLPAGILVVAVQSDLDAPATEVPGKLVGVVPTVSGLVSVPGAAGCIADPSGREDFRTAAAVGRMEHRD